jgi:hypothetical protein
MTKCFSNTVDNTSPGVTSDFVRDDYPKILERIDADLYDEPSYASHKAIYQKVVVLHCRFNRFVLPCFHIVGQICVDKFLDCKDADIGRDGPHDEVPNSFEEPPHLLLLDYSPKGFPNGQVGMINRAFRHVFRAGLDPRFDKFDRISKY